MTSGPSNRPEQGRYVAYPKAESGRPALPPPTSPAREFLAKLRDNPWTFLVVFLTALIGIPSSIVGIRSLLAGPGVPTELAPAPSASQGRGVPAPSTSPTTSVAPPPAAPESSAHLPPQKRAVEETTGSRLYATGAQGEGVYAISTSPLSRVETASTDLFNNVFLAVDRERGRIYVAATNGGSVSILSTSPLREIGAITSDVGWNTFSMALSPDGSSIFLTCATQTGAEAHDNQVVVLDAEKRATRGKIRVGEPRSVSYLALSPDGRELFVSHQGTVDVYEASTLNLLRQCLPRSFIGRIAVSTDGAFLVALQPGGLVRMRTDCSDVERVPLAGLLGYEPLTASARDGLFWVGSETESLYSFDARDLALRSVDLGYKPEGFAESADRQHVYVVTGNKNLVLDLDVPTGKVVQSLAGIQDSFGISAP